MYGPRQDPHGEAGVIAIFAQKMLAGEQVTIFGDGNQTRDYVFIDDVAHAFVQAMDRGSGKLVNIGTGLEASVNHLYRLLADIIGYDKDPEFGTLPPGELRRIALDIGKAPSASRGSRGPISRTASPRPSRSSRACERGSLCRDGRGPRVRADVLPARRRRRPPAG